MQRLAVALRSNTSIHTFFLDRNNAGDDFAREMGITLQVAKPETLQDIPLQVACSRELRVEGWGLRVEG